MRILTVAVVATSVHAWSGSAKAASCRAIEVNCSGAIDGNESRKIAQMECISHFGGDDVQFGFGGDGSFFVGTLFRDGKRPRYVFGLGGTLAGAFRLRIMATDCRDPSGVARDETDTPSDVRTVTMPVDGNHQTFLVAHLGFTSMSLTEFADQKVIPFAAALIFFIGLEREYIWWSKPSDCASRKTGFLAIGLLLGIGSAKDTTKDESYNAGLAGLVGRFGVRF